MASDAICISMHLCSLILCHHFCFILFLVDFGKLKGWGFNFEFSHMVDPHPLVLSPEYILRSNSNNNTLDSVQNTAF